MVKEAEEHAGEDKSRRELAEAKNQGEALAHATEKQLSENGEKIPAPDKAAIEAAIAALRTSLESDNTSDIAAKTQALVQASMKIGEALYGGAPQGEAPGGEAKPGEEGVVDADFEEVDGKKSA
jgi:molecular chaperone DnaK